MNYRRLITSLLVWLSLNGLVACQTRTQPTEQSTNIQPDTTIFDDDTLEGAIDDSVRPTNHNK